MLWKAPQTNHSPFAADAEHPYSYQVPTSDRLHPDTGLALVQPRDCLVTDEDLVALATAEAMFRGQMEAERAREQQQRAQAVAGVVDLADLGLEHGYNLCRQRAC